METTTDPAPVPLGDAATTGVSPQVPDDAGPVPEDVVITPGPGSDDAAEDPQPTPPDRTGSAGWPSSSSTAPSPSSGPGTPTGAGRSSSPAGSR